MTTLIIRKNTDGSITGRCDAKCYNARQLKCTCICAGINHGKGLNTATENASLYEEILQTAHLADRILFPHIQHKLFQEENI